jgi:hypothetical protein
MFFFKEWNEMSVHKFKIYCEYLICVDVLNFRYRYINLELDATLPKNTKSYRKHIGNKYLRSEIILVGYVFYLTRM